MVEIITFRSKFLIRRVTKLFDIYIDTSTSLSVRGTFSKDAFSELISPFVTKLGNILLILKNQLQDRRQI